MPGIRQETSSQWKAWPLQNIAQSSLPREFGCPGPQLVYVKGIPLLDHCQVPSVFSSDNPIQYRSAETIYNYVRLNNRYEISMKLQSYILIITKRVSHHISQPIK